MGEKIITCTRKETNTIYFCDVCKRKVISSDLLTQCGICGKAICFECLVGIAAYREVHAPLSLFYWGAELPVLETFAVFGICKEHISNDIKDALKTSVNRTLRHESKERAWKLKQQREMRVEKKIRVEGNLNIVRS